MKIKKDIIVNFLKEVRMSELENCLLEFKDKGLVISAKSISNTHMSYGILPKTEFEDYRPLGNAGVDALGTLIKIFSRLGDVIEFDIKGNLLTAKGKSMELQFPLTDEKFIDNNGELPEFDNETTFTMSTNRIKQFISDVTVNKDFHIIFETVDGGVKMKNTGKFKFTYNEDASDAKGGCVAKMGKPFINIMNNITKDDVVIGLKNQYPISITHDAENYTVSFIIAPIVDNE